MLLGWAVILVSVGGVVMAVGMVADLSPLVVLGFTAAVLGCGAMGVSLGLAVLAAG